MKTPLPSFEWTITYKCNYDCSYCGQRKSNQAGSHCSDETINRVFHLIEHLEGTWLIKLIGGEPSIHPRFFEICQKIIDNNHKLCMTTNLSLSLDKLQKLVDICGDKLDYITASLHTSQIKDIDAFVTKAARFNSSKNDITGFCVNSVLVENQFDSLKKIEHKLKNNGVNFKYQVMKTSKGYIKYTDKIETYISGKLIGNAEIIRGKNFFGTFCHTGELFFKIHIDGEVTRCYNTQPGFFMGNITKQTFKRFNKPKPCLSQMCTCTVPANRNMIRYGHKAPLTTILIAYSRDFLKRLINKIKLKKSI